LLAIAFFTALRGMPARTSYKKSVCLSVRPSIKRVICDKTKETCANIIIYLSFVTRRMVGGGDPFYLKFWVKLTPLERKRRFLIDIRP